MRVGEQCLWFPLDIANKTSAARPPPPHLNTLGFTRLGKYLKAGYLLKRSSRDPRGIVWRRKYVVLHAKALMTYRVRFWLLRTCCPCVLRLIRCAPCITQGWDRGWHCTPLALCTADALHVEAHPDLVAQQVQYVFELSSTKKTFQFRTNSAADLEKWMVYLKYAISTADANNSVELAECLIADEVRLPMRLACASACELAPLNRMRSRRPAPQPPRR